MRFKSRYIRAFKHGLRTAGNHLVAGYRNPMPTYSQCGEDVVLRSYFEELLGKGYQGGYVDVGCYHPFKYSNTCIFYQMGWRGINIDPTPTVVELFKKYRPQDQNLELAVSDSKEPVILNIFDDGAINSLDRELAESREGKQGRRISQRITVITKSLADILDEYWTNGRNIDFLDVDAEGADYQVLLSGNWEKYRPGFVLVEDDVELARLNESRIHKFMIGVDYRFAAATRATRIYERIN